MEACAGGKQHRLHSKGPENAWVIGDVRPELLLLQSRGVALAPLGLHRPLLSIGRCCV